MSTQRHKGIFSSRFLTLCAANLFLHIYIYAMVPLAVEHTLHLGGSLLDAAWGVLAFSVGMFLPGPFGAHLMERRVRKTVFLKALLVLGPVVSVGYVLATVKEVFLALQLVQGMAFGVAQTALGATLVNDVLHSNQRNKGDLLYGWAGRIGVPLGLFAGYVATFVFAFFDVFWWLLIPCALSFVLVAQTEIPVKAPVKVPLFTLDRFFLPKSLPLALSLLAAPWAIGRIAGSQPDVSAFLALAAGVAVACLVQYFVRHRVGQRTIVAQAYALVIVGLVVLNFKPSGLGSLIAYALVGMGAGGVSSRHLMDWICTSRHCQRGTAQNTYLLLWRLSFALGFLVSAAGCFGNFLPDALLCIGSFLVYAVWVSPLCRRLQAEQQNG